MALNFALKSGLRAEVLIDIGHHSLCPDIEYFAALLLDYGRSGDFRFGNRKYADDDFTPGSVDIHEFFQALMIFSMLNRVLRRPILPI